MEPKHLTQCVTLHVSLYCKRTTITFREFTMASKKIEVNGRFLGDDQPVFMIAEIGLNHNGSVQIAKKLIDAAFACNWHC